MNLPLKAFHHYLIASSGGRAEFKWEDVKSDQQRENYLGHSLMARMEIFLAFVYALYADLYL